MADTCLQEQSILDKELFLVISHSGLRIFFYYILFKTRAGNGEGELNQGTGSISEKLSPYPSEPVPLNGHDPDAEGDPEKAFLPLLPQPIETEADAEIIARAASDPLFSAPVYSDRSDRMLLLSADGAIGGWRE